MLGCVAHTHDHCITLSSHLSEHLINTAAAAGHSIIVKLTFKVPTPSTRGDNKLLEATIPSTLNIDDRHLGLENDTYRSVSVLQTVETKIGKHLALQA